MAAPNTLYYGDNLRFLADESLFPSESIDLVYLDPPFNSNATYNVLFREETGEPSEAQIRAFDDTWSWDRSAAAALDAMVRDRHSPTQLIAFIQTLEQFLKHSAMFAYLVQMAARLVHLHRVLRKTGSLYLHCDPTASHYLKLILDAIFGPTSFRNEIVWRRTGSHNKVRRYAPIHDLVLFYSKTDSYKWNYPKRPFMRGHVEQYFTQDAEGYRTSYYGNVLTGSGIRKGESGKPWRGFNPTAKGRHWAVPGAVLADIDEDLSDLGQHEKLDRLYELGFIKIVPGEAWPVYERRITSRDGQAAPDIWAFQTYTAGTVFGTDDGIDQDVRWLSPRDRERLGYPTQKPAGILSRIIRASSDPGDVVLDPFCGCGTTIDATETLNRENFSAPPRRWIGIDLTHLAINLIKYRLARFDPPVSYNVKGEPADATGAEQLFRDDPFQFQLWACSLVGARAATKSADAGPKKGADRGIDGVRYFSDGPAGLKTILVQVKGGDVGVSQIRDFRGTLEREKAALGVFVCLQEPTRPMLGEAAAAGVYTSADGSKTPRIQIVTLVKLLDGGTPRQPNGVQLPAFAVFERTFRKADVNDCGSLFAQANDEAHQRARASETDGVQTCASIDDPSPERAPADDTFLARGRGLA